MASSITGKLSDRHENGSKRSSNLINERQTPVINNIDQDWTFWLVFKICFVCTTIPVALGYIAYLCFYFNLGAVWPWVSISVHVLIIYNEDIFYMIIKPIAKFGMLVASHEAEIQDAKPSSALPPPWQSRTVRGMFYADRYLGGSPHYELGVIAAACYGYCVFLSILVWVFVKCLLRSKSSTAKTMVENENGIAKTMVDAKDMTDALRKKVE